MKSQVPIPGYTGDSQEVEAQRKNHFEYRIQSGERIEPKDWMPERYRSQLIRMISQHAHSEVIGMYPGGTGSPVLQRCAESLGCWRKCRTSAAMDFIYTLLRKRLGLIGMTLLRSCYPEKLSMQASSITPH